MEVEVLRPMSNSWLSKCPPNLPKYFCEGSVDHSTRSYVGNVSCLADNVSCLQMTEGETLRSPNLRQEIVLPRGIIPAMPTSIQLAGKSLLGRGETLRLLDGSVEESEQSTLWYHDAFDNASLIPGLPEDVAKKCLALVRREDFPSLRKVSKAWRDLVQTQEFYLTRKGAGTLEEWLYILTVAPDMKSTRWEVLNPKTEGDWKVLPPMPGLVKRDSGTVVVNEKLMVIGGLVVDDESPCASAEVYIYDPVLDKWTKGASMNTARYEFACGVLGGKVYVVGGHGTGQEALSSTEAYDPENDVWNSVTPLRKARWGCFAAGVEEKLYVLGGRCSFTLGTARFMDIFDPKTGTWNEVKNGCSMVLTHAVVNGKIFCIEWKDERSLRFYNTVDNSWTKVLLPLPIKSRASFCLGTYGGKLQFFPTTMNPGYETIVYDPEAPKSSAWKTTSVKPRGPCLSCATMTA